MHGNRVCPEDIRPTKQCVKCKARWRTFETCGYCGAKLVPIEVRKRKGDGGERQGSLFEEISRGSGINGVYKVP